MSPVSASPTVRISPGHGIALRTSGIVAWFAAPPDHPGSPEADFAGLVRDFVLAAGRSEGLPTDFLTTLVARYPWLTVAVVSLDGYEGRLWIHGDVDVVIKQDGDGSLSPLPGSGTRTFPLPARAVRLGDPHRAAAWSHLVEGAVPAGRVALVWERTGARACARDTTV